MRILILGGTRFIGPRVIRALGGHEITVFHRGLTCERLPEVHHIHGDRADLGSCRAVFRALQPAVVLDMIPQNAADAQQVIDNMMGITGRLVAVSSGSVYRSFGVMIGTEADQVDNTPSNEGSPLRRQLFPYRESTPRGTDDPKRWLDEYDKIPAEHVFLAHPELPCSIVRLPMVYGPGDPDHRFAAYLRRMVDRRSVVFLQETAARWRNARAYVDNVAEAIARVVLRGEPGRVYNVAEPHDFTEAEWVRRIGQQIGWRGAVHLVSDKSPLGRPAIDELPDNTNFAQNLRMDSARIRRELGYVEVVPEEEALRLTVESAINSLPVIDYRDEDLLLASLRSAGLSENGAGTPR